MGHWTTLTRTRARYWRGWTRLLVQNALKRYIRTRVCCVKLLQLVSMGGALLLGVGYAIEYTGGVGDDGKSMEQ